MVWLFLLLFFTKKSAVEAVQCTRHNAYFELLSKVYLMFVSKFGTISTAISSSLGIVTPYLESVHLLAIKGYLL